MNVLSLFDGISCGRIALERAGIPVTNYYASEIDKYAIRVSEANYPDIIRLGDVRGVKAANLPKIDLLLGGSPCQDLSIAKANRKGLGGDKSKLFYQYERLLKETKPKYFIFENVARMEKVDCEEITAALGVEPKSVNSNLLSFQNRDRLYWSNIDFDMPKAKGISFQNYKSTDSDYLDMFRVNRTPSREGMWGDGVNGKCKNVTHADKINCLTVKQDRWSNSGLVEHGNFCRYLTTEELEAAQTVPNGYCKMLTKNQAESVLGNAWTVDVIAHILSFIEKENK